MNIESLNIEAFLPLFFIPVFLIIAILMLRNFVKHGGITGMLFGAGIRRTVGEVECGAMDRVTTIVKIHLLDAAADKNVGLEFTTKGFGSIKTQAFVLSASEAQELSTYIQAAADGR